MKIATVVTLFLLLAAPAAPAADQPLFGPAKYDVLERYGKLNKYEASFAATPGAYIIKVQNGDKPAERSDYIELSLNGARIVLDDRYPFRYIACFVALGRDNRIELVLKDERPTGMKRPPAVPKNVVLTVLPVSAGQQGVKGSFGLFDWDAAKDLIASFRKITSPAAAERAMESASVHLNAASRAAALQKLSDLKEKSAEGFLAAVYRDPFAPPEVAAEAALAVGVLGNPAMVPALVQGTTHPDARISTASARALSFFPEEATTDPTVQVLSRLDTIRRPSTIRSISEAGWKPLKAVVTMSSSTDPYVASIGIELLGDLRDPRATDRLLELLKAKDPVNVQSVIRSLGTTSDVRATDALIAMASDPQRRSGRETDLADALSRIGDQRAAEVIGDMIRKAPSPQIEHRLRSAYRKLTKKNF